MGVSKAIQKLTPLFGQLIGNTPQLVRHALCFCQAQFVCSSVCTELMILASVCICRTDWRVKDTRRILLHRGARCCFRSLSFSPTAILIAVAHSITSSPSVACLLPAASSQSFDFFSQRSTTIYPFHRAIAQIKTAGRKADVLNVCAPAGASSGAATSPCLSDRTHLPPFMSIHCIFRSHLTLSCRQDSFTPLHVHPLYLLQLQDIVCLCICKPGPIHPLHAAVQSADVLNNHPFETHRMNLHGCSC